MKKYRSTIMYVEAEQWYPGIDIEGVVTTSEDILGIPYVRAYVYSCHGVMEVGIGDYVIKSSAGDIYPCREAIFKIKYALVKEGENVL